MSFLKRALKSTLFFALISLLLHFLGGLSLVYFEENWNSKSTTKEQYSITLVESPAPSEKAIESRKKSEDSTKDKKARQIVEQNVENNDEVNQSAELLSAKNFKIKKQTIAKDHGNFKNVKKSGNRSPDLASKSSLGGRLPSQLPPPKRAHLIPALGVGDFRVKDAESWLHRIEKQVQGDGQGQAERRIASEGSQSDSSQSQDYLKDVDKGLETLLNTREFKYYSYYNRIRRQLSQHWEGMVRDRVMQIYRAGRTIASNQDRITKLLVTLNSTGLLVKIQVLSDSGVQDLDEAAVDAFRAAAPFPNPPKGIIETDGTVRIRWDMVLET